ncbi:unnamed protein product [Linum trigynum]|uniref:Uncharacterized protein n=1 Tax=Linum trigynum TaxID=586398 RepID=A0AAV2D8H7_9ROSI
MLRMPKVNKSIGQFDDTVDWKIGALVLLSINPHIHPNPFKKGGQEGGIWKGSVPVFPSRSSLNHVQAHERCEVNRNTSLSLHKDKQVKFTNNRMTTIPWHEAVDDHPVEESKRIWEERSLDAPLSSVLPVQLQTQNRTAAQDRFCYQWGVLRRGDRGSQKTDEAGSRLYDPGRSTRDENRRDQTALNCGRTSSPHAGSNWCFLDSGDQRTFPAKIFN